MLYDSISVQQVVDSESAHEFLKQATQLATSSELEDIGRRLEQKSAMYRAALAPPNLDGLDEAAFRTLAGTIFGMRRHVAPLLGANGMSGLRSRIRELLYGPAEVGQRVGDFAGNLEGFEPDWAITLAAELLHYSDPGRYWLCSRWLWDRSTQGGALPLVLQKGCDLDGASPAEVYNNVGRAIVMVNAAGHAEGFTNLGPGLIGTNVFLASVYAVYMYTVFRMKLSQEFNRILPELPELTRRILGVQRMEVK